MNVASLILATLNDSGPADIRGLRDALHAGAGPQASCFVYMPLYQLVHAGRVLVNCGVYSAA